MALPWAYRPFTPTQPSGQATQNQLYRTLAAASYNPPPLQTTPVLGVQPNDPSFGGTPGGGAYGTYPGSGDLPGPNVPGGPPAGNPTQSPAAGATTTTTGGGGGGGGSGPGGMNLDFSGDPILAQIRALNVQNISNAEAAALARRKQAEIGYGYDPNLQYEDPATAEAARQNPFSALAQLLFGHQQRGDQLTEALNKGNLFYSGERIKQTGLEGRQYTLEQAQANAGMQGLMGQIAQGVLDAKMQAQQQELGGESAAYDRAIQFALANNTGYPGGPGGGGGPGGANLQDFMYGSTVPGYSDEALWGAAVAGAPAGATPMHVMNQGMVQNGMISIKYRMPDGTTNTIWVPLPPGQQPAAAAPAPVPAPVAAPVAPPVVTALAPTFHGGPQ